jgi:hypothetical protein
VNISTRNAPSGSERGDAVVSIPLVQNIRQVSHDLPRLFWTKLCEKMSLERSVGHAEEEVQRGADRCESGRNPL